MAVTCTAESLWSAADCFGCLSDKQLAAISVLQKCNFLNGISVNCTPKALLAAAVAAGFDKLSEKQLAAVSAYLDCQIANTGGSGGGPSPVQCGNYAGGQPNFTPASGCALAIDTSNGALWEYYSGAWH